MGISAAWFIILWWTNIAIENGHRNSGFSHYKMVIFHSKLLVHQRVFYKMDMGKPTGNQIFWPQKSRGFLPQQASISAAGDGNDVIFHHQRWMHLVMWFPLLQDHLLRILFCLREKVDERRRVQRPIVCLLWRPSWGNALSTYTYSEALHFTLKA